MTIYVYISESSYIASSGAGTTTAVLTPPSGKTTADFQSGLISDDVNPVPAINLLSDKYTELVFMLKTDVDTINTGDEIEFRITDSGSVLDTYSVVPKITSGVVQQILVGTGAVSNAVSAVGTLINNSSTIVTGVYSAAQVVSAIGTLYIDYALITPILNTAINLVSIPLSVSRVTKAFTANQVSINNTADRVTKIYSINKTT